MNLPEIARKAAEIISSRGMTKGTLLDGTGRVCLNGAILLAMGIIPEELLDGNAVSIQQFLRDDSHRQQNCPVQADPARSIEESPFGHPPGGDDLCSFPGYLGKIHFFPPLLASLQVASTWSSSHWRMLFPVAGDVPAYGISGKE